MTGSIKLRDYPCDKCPRGLDNTQMTWLAATVSITLVSWSVVDKRPTLLCRWILRLRLPGTVGRPCLPLRICAGERSGWPAHCLCRRTAPAVSGQRDLGRSRAVRSLLGRLERRSLKANVLRNGCIRTGTSASQPREQTKAPPQRNATRP
jgi:hypothetical protein